MSNTDSANRRESRFSLGLVAMIFAAVAMVAAALAWYQVAVTGRLEANSQRALVERVAAGHDSIGERQDKTSSRIDQLQNELPKLREQTGKAIESLSESQNSQIQGFREEFRSLTAAVEKVYLDLGRSVDSWMLEEAEQLLLLANQRLTLASDVDLATSALTLADAKILEIGDPALMPVRRKLAAELAELAATPRIDISGAALKILSLTELVERLPLAEDMNAPEWELGQSQAKQGSANESTLEKFSRQILGDLGELVSVRRVEETQLPKLKPVQRFLVNENLRVMLNSAQYALLRGDGGLFRRNMDNARGWTIRYFDPGDEVVKNFAAEIDQLAGLSLDRPLPSISGSLELLRQHMRERSRQ